MPYIYRYLDRSDGVYKYIGISKNKDTLRQRIKSHEHDYWHRCGNWYIDYAFVKSKADVEFLEGVLIAEHGTWAWYNVAKATWGHSVLFDVPRLNWKVFQWGDDDCLYTFEGTNADGCESSVTDREPWKFRKERQDLLGVIEKEKARRKISERNLRKLEKELEQTKKENKFLRDCNSELRESNILLDKEVASLSDENKLIGKRMDAIDRELRKRERIKIDCNGADYKRSACIATSSRIFARKTS